MAGTAGILAAFDRIFGRIWECFYNKIIRRRNIGSIGSIRDAVIGGYIIGLAENILITIPFGDFYIPSNYKDTIAFVVLLILYIKPTGYSVPKNNHGLFYCNHYLILIFIILSQSYNLVLGYTGMVHVDTWLVAIGAYISSLNKRLTFSVWIFVGVGAALAG